MAIAIDFGTSNTVICRWNSVTQQPETLRLPGLSVQQGTNPPLIPSLVYVEDASHSKVVVGQLVRDRGLDLSWDSRFFRNFKRGIGSPIQGFLPELDGMTMTFERVGEWFLAQLTEQLKAENSLVLTVPVDSFEAYRHWLRGICQQLCVEQVRMLDEPTAAALGYGMEGQEMLLVIDFGGGTLDLSVVRLDSAIGKKPSGVILKWGEKSFADKSEQKIKTARVLAKSGQNLGGSDIDNWLVDYFGATQGLVKSPLTTRLAEKLKIKLSQTEWASEVYFDPDTLDSYELELDRNRFGEILQQHRFFDQLDETMDRVIQQSRRQGFEIDDIDAVLLVGGTVQIPAVRDWVQQYFDRDKIKFEQPFEAIARGALQLVQGIELKDFLYHGYGIRYWNKRNQRHGWHPIIREGQPYPMNEAVELVLGASVENQPSIELVIGELGTQEGGTEVYFDGDRLITRILATDERMVQPLNDKDDARTIAQLAPPGYPGRDRVKVMFRVDEQRFLRMTVEDLLTNQNLLSDRPVVQLS